MDILGRKCTIGEWLYFGGHKYPIRDAVRAIKVIKSCKSNKQLFIAEQYIKLLARRSGTDYNTFMIPLCADIEEHIKKYNLTFTF